MIDSVLLDNLGEALQDYISSNLPKVRLIRTEKREGLIRARIIGSDNATGQVIGPYIGLYYSLL